jgi:AcrR family transcriptional regulator
MTTPPANRSVRAAEILSAAREVLEEVGFDGLRMRTLATRLGITAPALYAHFRDKREIENALIAEGLREQGAALAQARDAEPDRNETETIWAGFRRWALANPALHKLIAARALDFDDEEVAAAEALGVANVRRSTGGHRTAGVAFWAFASGMVELEISGRVPPGYDLDAAWTYGLRALTTALAEPPDSR